MTNEMARQMYENQSELRSIPYGWRQPPCGQRDQTIDLFDGAERDGDDWRDRPASGFASGRGRALPNHRALEQKIDALIEAVMRREAPTTQNSPLLWVLVALVAVLLLIVIVNTFSQRRQ